MDLYICIVLSFVHAVSSDCVIDNRSKENTWETQLDKDILCNYHSKDSPEQNGTVAVTIRFIFKGFKLIQKKETLALRTWVYMTWNDVRLKWNASEYDGIRTTVMMSPKLWYPRLRLLNAADPDDYDQYFYEPCQIRYNGRVLCIRRMNMKSRCKINFKHWPYDVQKCVVDFGAGIRDRSKVRFRFRKESSVVMINTRGEWDFIDYDQEAFNDSNLQMRMSLKFERQALSLAAINLFPSLVLALLTTTSVFLDVRCYTRLGMVCFSLANHFFFLTELQEDIPKHSTNAPLILMFYRGSVIGTILLVLLTVLLKALCERETAPPLWVTSFHDFVLKSRWERLVWPRWESRGSSFTKDWTKLMNVLNSVCIIITVLVYLGMFLAFFPCRVRIVH